MDEADQILVTDLNGLGIKVDTLQEVKSNTFVYAIGVVLGNIGKLLGQNNFMTEEKLRTTQNFEEVSNKFQVCQVLVSYLKKLGFYYDVNFNHFFYPNIHQIRRILGFLFEYISKKEEEIALAARGEAGEFGADGEENNYEFMTKRRLKKWVKKPWIMPEFYVETKNTFLRNRRKIRVLDERDKELLSNTKNKKVLGVHEFLDQVKVFNERINFKNESLNPVKIADTSFYKAFETEQNDTNDFLDDGENEMEIKRREFYEEKQRAFENLRDLIPRKPRNINEIIRSRQKFAPEEDQDIEEYNLFNRNVKVMESKEEDMNIDEQIQIKKKAWKKKKDMLSELESLQQKGIAGLDQEIADLEAKFSELQKQLDEYQKPIEEEIRTGNEELQDMKLEYGFKANQIKDIKKQIKKALAELKYKKEMLKFMEEEYSKIPKDINRNQYIKRINEVVNNVKLQQEEIQRSLKDLTSIQEEISDEIRKISKLDKEIEDMLFKPAQKDKIAKKIYEEYLSLKDAFSKLIETVQSQNLAKNATKEVSSNIEAFKGKYKNFEDYKKIEDDLVKMQEENAKLEAYISKNA
ncbi:unnamed protein product [Moneuplotes crassus]|uniref:Uncharacterized protein n=1 Tax=Euplotes crassus TaxID=5936 RepID=A0AAD1U807_EUPCR|nr:unnamed protein product [Moneuplotes crassus]